MPRISEVHFNDQSTGRFPANEFVEIALSQEEYAALQSGNTQVHLALYQSDGRNSFDFTIPLSSFMLDEDSNEWVAVEHGTDYFNRTGSNTPSNRWTISASNSQRDTPRNDSLFVAETVGVYTVNTNDNSVIDSDIVSPVSDGTDRAAPRSGPLAGKPVNAVPIDPSTNTGSLQFNAPKKDPTLAEPTPGDTGVICFAGGTLIHTDQGEVSIEDLKIGDNVLTADAGYQKLRWIGYKALDSDTLKSHPHLCPIRVRANSLGKGYPQRDLILSPQHRILVNGSIPQRMFGAREVLVAVKHLLELDGIEIADDLTEVTYVHILFDRHQIVWANGTLAESLYTGSEALKTLNNDQLKEIAEIFLELPTDLFSDTKETISPPPARPIIIGRRGRKLAARIKSNNQNVFFEEIA